MSNTLRLYTKQTKGGRELVSVRANIQNETAKSQEYIRRTAPNDDLLGEYLRQQIPSEEKEEGERPAWRDKPLHDIYQNMPCYIDG